MKHGLFHQSKALLFAAHTLDVATPLLTYSARVLQKELVALRNEEWPAAFGTCFFDAGATLLEKKNSDREIQRELSRINVQ